MLTFGGRNIHLFMKLKELHKRCEVNWSHVAMVRCWMMFRPVVSIVRGAGAPIKSKLFLCAAILQPMKVHIHGLGAFLLHPFVDDAFGC